MSAPALEVVPSRESLAPPAQVPKLSLFEVEENLATLIATSDLVPEEQRYEFLTDLGEAIIQAVDKRERVHHFLCHLESQVFLAKQEIARLQDRKSQLEHLHDKMEEYVVKVVKAHKEPDAKGRYPKLDARTVTLSLRACPASVEITDEPLVPSQFKRVAVQLPADTWEAVMDAIDVDLRGKVLEEVRRPDMTISRSLLKEALEREAAKPEDGRTAIPGAKLLPSGTHHSLQRK